MQRSQAVAEAECVFRSIDQQVHAGFQISKRETDLQAFGGPELRG